MVAILKWMFVLTLLILVAGGGAAYWMYTRSDEGLRQIVLQQLRTMAPSLKIDIASANWHSMNQIRLAGVTASLPDDGPDDPSLEIPEVIATLDPDQLTNLENVAVQKLYLVKPKLHLIRSVDQSWNWQKCALASGEGSTLPDVEIEHATISTEFQLANKAPRKLVFKHFNVSLRPLDSRHLSARVATLVGPAGPLMLDGVVATDGSSWHFGTDDDHPPWRIPVNRQFVELLCDLSPQIADQSAKVGPWLDQINAVHTSTGAHPSELIDQPNLKSMRTLDAVLGELGAKLDVDLSFRIQKDRPDQPVAFKTLAKIVRGEINHKLTAYPIEDLKGEFYVDNRQINITGLKAISGKTQYFFSGQIVPSTPINATFKVRNLEINDRLKNRLPIGLRKVAHMLRLTGVCDMDANVVQNGSRWQSKVDAFLTDGTVTHEKFPVVVRNIAGELHLKDDVLTFDAKGKYAGRDVESRGTITNPGPEQMGDIVITSENLPVDDESIAACPLPVQASIQSLNLRGRHSVLLRITRPPGPDQKWEPLLIDKVTDASMSFQNFPYAIRQLQGIVKWKGDLVEFTKLSGFHDGARLDGEGSFTRNPGRGRLDLNISAKDATFDRSLHAALPAKLRAVWNQFQPRGNFDVDTLISWVPGSPCNIKLPKVIVNNGEVKMKCFPWALQELSGKFEYNVEPGKLVISDLLARHDATLISGNGLGLFNDRDPWKLDFRQLNVDGLRPDETFRDALPEYLQKSFDVLQPKGNFSFSGPISLFDLSRERNSVGAVWKLDTVLSDCSIRAGSRIDGMNGVITLEGKWDGLDASLSGLLDLDSMLIFRTSTNPGYQITKIQGPISYNNHKFIAGTTTAIPPRESNTPDENKRIRGRFIDGAVFVDAEVDVGNEPDYKAFVELKNGKLEYFAKQYLRGQSGLAGTSNGWINLKGKGTNSDRMVGDGKVVIAPAALYDSPLFIQMFKILSLQSSDRAAFRTAEVNFTVGGGRFDLNRIEMYGDALSMGGRGYVRFDGGMQLDLGVYLKQWWPNVSPLTAVKVTGNIGEPKVKMSTLPELDGTVRQMMEALTPRMRSQPNLFAPQRMGKKKDTETK